MAFQYGDLRVDQLTYTSGGANQTVTVSGLVQQVTTGGTTSGDVRIEGDLTVTGTIEGNVISGNTINATTANLTNISGTSLTYTSGTISGLIVQGDATVTGNLNTVGTVTGEVVTATTGSFTTLTGITTTGTTANFTTGNFQNLSGQTITGDTINANSGVFNNISGGSLVVNNITITGNDGGSINLPPTITGVSGIFTFISGQTITGDTIQGTTGIFEELDIETIVISGATFQDNVVISGDLTVEGTITGVTITGTTINATTGNFTVIEGPISTTTVTGVTRIATADEAASAVGPSGTYTDTISGDANSAFAINPSGLSSAIRAYDPPVGDSAGTKIYVRSVTTTGIAPDFAISGVTWSGITGVDVDPVTDLQATSAVRPSGTYGVAASGTATSEFFYNPVQLEKTFKAYDPASTAAEEQLYARVVSGTSDGQGGFTTTSYGWIQVPTGTATIATEAQAEAAAGASGTYSETPTAANVANIINPNRLRAALQSYDPGIVSGERRVYARVVSGVTATSGDYEWLNVTNAVAGNFLPLTGGTVDGYTNFTSGLGISGNVQITGNITQTGNHTTSGTYNASRSSNPSQVLYQVNNSAGRGMYQGDHQGVAFAKGGSGVAEFTVTGDQTFGVISGDLRVGNDNQNVSDANSSQFWALSGGQFISAFSTDESVVWKDATQGEILRLQSNVGGQRTNHFQFTASGALGLSGEFGTDGQVLTSRGTTTGVHWTNLPGQGGSDGFFNDLFISGDVTITGDLAVSGSSTFNTINVTGEVFDAVRVSGGIVANSGVFFTEDTETTAMALFATAQNTGSPNLVLSQSGTLRGATTRNSIAIGRNAQSNATADSDRNIAIGNNALQDMGDGHRNVAIGHGAMQNIVPGNNQGANVAIGDQALFGNTSANNSSRENIAIGQGALFDAFQARENVVIGMQAGANLTTATGNVVIGNEALETAQATNANTVIGNQAGESVTTGAGNLLLGALAGSLLTTGNSNTIIGSSIGEAGLANTVILAAGNTERLRINDAGTVLIPNGAAPQIELNNDGSVSLADGEVTIATDGDTVISGSLQVGPNTLTHEAGTTQQNESLVTATAFDMSSGTFYCVSGAIAVPNPTNQLAGQAGIMRCITAAPASFGNNFNFPGGGAPTITGVSATTNTIIPFYVPASGTIICGAPIQNVSGTNSLGTQVDRGTPAGGQGGAANNMTITSTSFNNGATIPDRFTQNGGAGQNNGSPQFTFSNLPAGTTSGSFQCLDISANNFIHWNVTNIPVASMTGIAQDAANFPGVPTVQVGNVGTFNNPVIAPGTSAGPFLCRTNGWGGPAPGVNTNTYVFTLTAFDNAGTTLGTTTYTGTFV